MYSQITANKRKSWLLIGVFIIIITLFGFLFAQVFNNSAILVWCLAISVIYAWISYYHSDKMVLAVSGAKEVQKKDAPELYRLVENLAMTAGLPTPKVYVISDASPNAFATGRDPKHAVVAVTTGILERLDKTELEGVLAHELSHVGNYDIRLMALVTVLVAVIAMLADWFLRLAFWGGEDDNNGGGQMQMILIAVGLVLSIIVPIIGSIIQLSVSRNREYLADASGALLTRYPKGLADALRKISDDTKPLKRANKATANLYIVNPLRQNIKGQKRSWGASLFSTHPLVEDRIKKLTEMEDKV